ncbi:iron-sulfur cluster assembly protein [Nocardia sp. NPDC055049]
MTLVTALTITESQVRVPWEEARAALDTVTGLTAPQAREKLRFAAGHTCEPVARIIDKAMSDARSSGLDPQQLVVTAAAVTAGEDIVRVRRKAHGKADWIASATSDIRFDLTPRGLYEATGADVAPAPLPAASRREDDVADRGPADRDPLADSVRELLYEVIDPDLGINIVDLGFVRNVAVELGRVAIITMTLTSAACPLTEIMSDQMRAALLPAEGDRIVSDFRIEWQWVPAWKPSDITADGCEQLQAIGFTI